MSQSVTRSRIDDEACAVASLIERCPKVMMLRELVRAAIAAAAQAPDGTRRVDILTREVAGSRKLAIRNTGPGLSADALLGMSDIAASLGQGKPRERGFAERAMVAALPANRLGVRYRSCKGGRVQEVLIGKRGQVYCRVRRTDPLTARAVEVADATGAAIADGHALDHDWTEVTLLGDRVEQDTVVDPFDGDPGSAPNWIADGLYRRFYRIPDGLDLLLHPGTHAAGGDVVAFRPIAARDGDFARAEAVTPGDGVRLQYRLDPPDPAAGDRNRSEAGALQSTESMAGIVFRDEIYDMRAGAPWSQVGARFGLAAGVRHVSVHVELPDDAAVLPDAYCQTLHHAGGGQAVVALIDYAAVVAAHRPAWLVEQLRALGPDTRIVAALRDEMRALLRALGVRRPVRGAWQPPGFGAPATTPLAPPGPPALSSLDDDGYDGVPEIVLLRDVGYLDGPVLNGRAACYDAASHALFVDMNYGAFAAMKTALGAEFAGSAPPGALAAVIAEAAERALVRRIGRGWVHGIAKRHATPRWNDRQLDGAVSPEALTLAADDFVWALPGARADVARSLAGLAHA